VFVDVSVREVRGRTLAVAALDVILQPLPHACTRIRE